MLVRLCHHHPDMLLGSLRSINMSLMKQAKNLRSQVSRAAIQAFTCFYDKLKRNMEPVSVWSFFLWLDIRLDEFSVANSAGSIKTFV